MSREKNRPQSPSQTESENGFTDPGRKPWVWLVLVCLLAGMVPIWPVSGDILGFPGWAVLAISVSLLTSTFILYVILFVWRDPGDDGESK